MGEKRPLDVLDAMGAQNVGSKGTDASNYAGSRADAADVFPFGAVPPAAAAGTLSNSAQGRILDIMDTVLGDAVRAYCAAKHFGSMTDLVGIEAGLLARGPRAALSGWPVRWGHGTVPIMTTSPSVLKTVKRFDPAFVMPA